MFILNEIFEAVKLVKFWS